MSVMSLLSTQSCAELREFWHSVDFDQLGISFARASAPPAAASGLLSFHGVSFTYDIQSIDKVEAAQHIFCNTDMGDVQSAIHFDLGPAVQGGSAVPAIAKVFMQLGEVLGRSVHAKAVYWVQASIVSGFDYYSEAVTQYIDGAAFPALICVRFDTSDVGVVETHGLKWFCGQDLIFHHAPMATPEAMRYVVRLVHDLATQGAVLREVEVSGLSAGETIILAPHAHKGIVIARFLNPQ